MADAKRECEYLVRTLAATMLDLSPDDRSQVLRFLVAEMERLDMIEPGADLAGIVRFSEQADLRGR